MLDAGMQASRASGLLSARPVLQPCRLPSWPLCHAQTPGDSSLLTRAAPSAHAVAEETAEVTTPLLTPDAIVSLPLRQPQQLHASGQPMAQRRHRRTAIIDNGHGMDECVHGRAMQGSTDSCSWHMLNSEPPPHASELQAPNLEGSTLAWPADGTEPRVVEQLVHAHASTSYSSEPSSSSQSVQGSRPAKGRGRHKQEQHESQQGSGLSAHDVCMATASGAQPAPAAVSHHARNGSGSSTPQQASTTAVSPVSSQQGSVSRADKLPQSKQQRLSQPSTQGAQPQLVQPVRPIAPIQTAARFVHFRGRRRIVIVPLRFRGKLFFLKRPASRFRMTVSQTSDFDVWGAFLAAQQGMAPPQQLHAAPSTWGPQNASSSMGSRVGMSFSAAQHLNGGHMSSSQPGPLQQHQPEPVSGRVHSTAAAVTTVVVPAVRASQWVRALRRALHEAGNAPAASVPGRSRRPEDNLCIQFRLGPAQAGTNGGGGSTGRFTGGPGSMWHTARLVHKQMANGELLLAAELPCHVPTAAGNQDGTTASVLHARLSLLQCGSDGVPRIQPVTAPGSQLQLQPGCSYRLLPPPASCSQSPQQDGCAVAGAHSPTANSEHHVVGQPSQQCRSTTSTSNVSSSHVHGTSTSSSSGGQAPERERRGSTTGTNHACSTHGSTNSGTLPVQRLLTQPVLLVAELSMVTGREAVPRDDAAAARFRAMWEASQALQPSMLVYTTHRCWRSFLQTWQCKQAVLAAPDVVLLAGGTRIAYQTAGGQWQEDTGWRARLESDPGWRRSVVVRAVQRVAAAFNGCAHDCDPDGMGSASSEAGSSRDGQGSYAHGGSTAEFGAHPGGCSCSPGGSNSSSSGSSTTAVAAPPPPPIAPIMLVKPDAAKEQNAHRVRVLVRAHVADAFAAALDAELRFLACGNSSAGRGRQGQPLSQPHHTTAQHHTLSHGAVTGPTSLGSAPLQHNTSPAALHSSSTSGPHTSACGINGWVKGGGGSTTTPLTYEQAPTYSARGRPSLTWCLVLQGPQGLGVRAGLRSRSWAAVDIIPASAGEAAALQHVCARFRIHAARGPSAAASGCGVPIVVAGSEGRAGNGGTTGLQQLATHAVLRVRHESAAAGDAPATTPTTGQAGTPMAVARCRAWGADAVLQGLEQLGLM